ncbi:MAG: mechanosensitive ion channel family protein [Prosthecochloris sp.]|uniref:mechanosensitive ion channel family protein n=1 Tax=Prosthecochloris sp. ZM_2 TaxID=2045206 RepID=UPI000DF7B517|nr:mechanosensitive ion channel family protein [Prosthecochloris sp. ZM_2]MEC9486578.1 mechanosensitive ion channel family protein [Prosthecochloris sp.]RNA65195.1 mechanosensitive ion channel family protein [Prosthecochloris sp. ZM_2]
MLDFLLDYLQTHGFTPENARLILTVLMVLLGVLVLAIAEVVTKRVLLRFLSAFAARTLTRLDDMLLKHKVFRWVAHLVPPLLLYNIAVPVLQFYPALIGFVQSAATLYLTVIVILLSIRALDAVQEYYNTHRIARRLPLKSFIQVLKTAIVTIGTVVVVAKLLGQSPVVFFSGIGAFTAIIILIFKDSILGFVAGIQLSTNDLVRVGDWIEMPKYGADGDVIDISLVTVSVQNWDKTISTIPAYALISEGFKNWRGMSDSGGRRIMRSIMIDMQSVRFCDREMLGKLQGVQLLRDYLDNRQQDIDEFNRRSGVDTANPVNGRRMTNLGVFRAYLIAYLRQHPKINQEMTFLVRHLQPTETGIPVQIYVFCNDIVWPNYEAIQADIMDHVLAVLPFFGLRVFQVPSGGDIAAAGRAIVQLARSGEQGGQ